MDPALIMKPKEQKFMKVLIWFTRVLGLWPNKIEEIRERTLLRYHSKLILALFPVVLLSETLFIKNHGDASFFEKGHMYITATATWIVEVRSILPETKKYCLLVKHFFEKIHLSNYKDHDEFSRNLLFRYEKYCYYLSAFLMLNVHGGFILFNILPAYNNWVNDAYTDPDKEFQSVIYMQMPWENEYNLHGWLYASVLYIYISATASYIVVYADIFMMNIFIHALGHVEILKHNFIRLIEDVEENDVKISEEKNEEFYQRMCEIHRHHKFVNKTLNDFTEVYGVVLIVNYIYHSVSCCILLLELSEGTVESAVRYGPLGCFIFGQLIGTSVMGEMLADSYSELSDAVYAAPWPAMSLRNQRLVRYLLMMAQKEFSVKACGLIYVSLATMQAILKSSFSYFLFLKTMGSESRHH